MDIHPSHRSITSLKDFFRELVTITAGILVALSLEGLLAWQHHRDLARDARANIIGELQSNQRELANERRDLDKMDAELRELIELVHQLESRNAHIPKSVPFIWSLAELHATGWDSAQSTGAVSYMPYEEVKRYTEVYDLQRDFHMAQQRGFGASLDVEGLETLLGREDRSLMPADLSDAERKLGVAKANVGALKELSASLQHLYEQALGARE
jgi:hypothetical protein